MFNHLFATYEAVDPPPNYKPDISIETPMPSIDFINLLDLPISSSIDSLLSLGEPDNEEDSFLRYIYTNFLLLSSDPFIDNLDIRKPDNPKGVFSSNLKYDFVKSLNNGFKKALQEKGLDINYAPILTAQVALESGWGLKVSGKFNYGGRKASKYLDGIKARSPEYSKEKGYHTKVSKFLNFNSIEDFCRNLIEYLLKDRYKAFETVESSNPRMFIHNIHRKGYATSPTYVNKVMGCYNDVMKILNNSSSNNNLVSIDIEDLLKQEGITSVNGKEIHFGDSNLRTSNIGSPNSHHRETDKHTGKANARDISIKGGTWQDYADLRAKLLNNNRIKQYMQAKGWGIINELTTEARKKYKSTGPHFHFGPDTAAVKTWNAWLKNPHVSVTKLF